MISSLLVSVLLLAVDAGAPARSGPILLVVNKETASLSFVDVRAGQEVAEVPLGGGPHEVAVSPDGRTAVVPDYTGGAGLHVVDVGARRRRSTIDLGPHGRPHGVRFLPGGRRVVMTSEGTASLVVVDLDAGRVERALDAGGGVHLVEVAPDGRTAWAVAIQDGVLCRVDLTGERPVRRVPLGAGSEALALLPERGEVWVGSNSEHVVRVVDARSLEVVATIECGLQPIRLAATPDGSRVLATLLLSGDVAVLDVERRAVVHRVKVSDAALEESAWKGRPVEEVRRLVRGSIAAGGARPIGVLIEPDGSHAWVAARGLGHVARLDLSSWAVVARVPTAEGPDGLAWVP